MLTENELLERALKGLAKLTQKSEPTEPKARAAASEAQAPIDTPTVDNCVADNGANDVPPEFADAIAEFDKYFEITSVRMDEPNDRGVPYAAWKARELNRIFGEHGTGGPGRIAGRTVQDGIEKQAEKRRKGDRK